MMTSLALIAGCCIVLGSYHLGYNEGLKQAAQMTEECLDMALDCLGLRDQEVDDGK